MYVGIAEWPKLFGFSVERKTGNSCRITEFMYNFAADNEYFTFKM